MNITVIYHSADYDGIFCREIARKFLPNAELIAWNFGDPPLGAVRLTTQDTMYVLDLPIDKTFAVAPGSAAVRAATNLVWIDHHKSAIDSHPADIPGYRIDGVAACRLAWQWFTLQTSPDKECLSLPLKLNYVNRQVNEPLAVRLAGEYDVWDKRDPRADTFQYGLRVGDLSEDDWQTLLSDGPKGEAWTTGALLAGATAQSYQKKIDADVAKHRSFDLRWEELNFMAINAVRCNSLTFEAAVRPDHDALLGFYWNGKVWTVSMYHAPHRKDLDLSAIAVKHGGGGHRGACGFTTSKLPFPL